jgi:hypothetical protein
MNTMGFAFSTKPSSSRRRKDERPRAPIRRASFERALLNSLLLLTPTLYQVPAYNPLSSSSVDESATPDQCGDEHVDGRLPSCLTDEMRRQVEWYARIVALLLFGGVIGYGIGAGRWAFVIVPVVVLVLLLLTGQFRLPTPPRAD